MTRSLQKLRVDAAMDAYVDWREACAAVRDAYRDWDIAVREDAGFAFMAYLATLDREERAARRYGRLIMGIETLQAQDAETLLGPGVLRGERVTDERYKD
jgi:hypothetical protein